MVPGTVSNMSEIKDFDAIRAAKRREKGEGPSFRLLGVDWHTLPAIPAWKMALYGEKAEITFMDSLIFVSSLIVESEREAFLEAVKDDEVDVDTLNDVIGYVMEEYSGRPPTGDES